MKPRVMGAEPGRHGERRHDASDSACSPRLVIVREPDQLGAERAYPQLAFSVRLVKLPTLDVDRFTGEKVVAAAVVVDL